jgi:hypothetical protein
MEKAVVRIDQVLIAVGALLLGLVLGRVFAPAARQPRRASLTAIPPDVSLRSQPVLTETEATFYNLLCLAVQDRLLVLSQVPLWCLVEVQSQDAQMRRRIMGHMALRRVDFALVHPGTRLVEQVIDLDHAANGRPARPERDREVELLLNAAGIRLQRLDARNSYTVRELASLVGVTDSE